MLAWASDPGAAWRRLRTCEGALLIATVAALGVLAVSTDEPVTYMVFPALIWAAFRFGPPGATLSIAIAAGVAIGVTANDVGPVLQAAHRPQDAEHAGLHRRGGADDAVPERRRQRARARRRQLAEAKRREGEQAVEERHRIARDLHDSVSQALFSTLLHTRTAQKALAAGGRAPRRQRWRETSARSAS